MKNRAEKFFAKKPERFWKDELSKMEMYFGMNFSDDPILILISINVKNRKKEL